MSTAQSTTQTKVDPSTTTPGDLSKNQIRPVESRADTQYSIRPTGAAQEASDKAESATPTGGKAENAPESKKQGYSEDLLKKIEQLKGTLGANKDEITSILQGKFAQGVSEARMQKAVAKLDQEMKELKGDDVWVKKALTWGGIALIERVEQKYGEFSRKNFQRYLEDRAPKAEKKPEPEKKAEPAPVAQTEPKPTPQRQTAPKPQADPTPKPSAAVQNGPHTHDAPSAAEKAKAEKLNNSLGIPTKYTTDSNRIMYRDNHGIDPDANRAFEEMRKDAASKGVQLKTISHYRGYEEQHENVRSKVTPQRTLENVLKFNMPVGYTQHHTGRAIDVGDATRPDTDVKESFETTPAFKYLEKNAARFGFSMPYPKGGADGISYEPWHLYYTGKK